MKFFWRSCLLLLTVTLTACSERPLDNELDRLVKVKVFTSSTGAALMTYPGKLVPRYKTQLAFQVEGRIIERFVDIGSHVSSGSSIALMDQQDYKLDSDNLRSQIDVAKSNYERSTRDLERAKKLKKQGFVGEAELDGALNEAVTSKATLAALTAQHGVSLNKREYTQLLAPVEGLITSINAEVGDVVRPAEAVATLSWDKDWEFATAVAEKHVNHLKIGQEVSIQFWVMPEIQVKALVREISPVASPSSNTFAIKLSLPSRPVWIKLGMTGVVLMPEGIEKRSLLPVSSVLNIDSNHYVVTVNTETDVTQRQKVTMGLPVGDQVNILSGVDEGQLVVVAGAHKISIGERVRVLK